MASAPVVGMALAAFFHLCVPIASNGEIKQTFPMESIVEFTDAEKGEYKDAVTGPGEFKHVLSKDGFIILNTEGPYCRIYTGDGEPRLFKQAFLEALKTAGGKVEATLTPAPDAETLSALIPLAGTKDVAIAFTIPLEKDAKGFFVSAFLVEKKH